MFRKACLILGLAGIVFAASPADSAFDAERYLSYIKYLASPEMRGRESGSPELEKAAQYIAGQFKADGLKPPDGQNYLQAFEVTTSAKAGKANRFDFSLSGDRQSLQFNKDFVPFSFSARGKVSAGVVFAGYGIT